NDTFYNQAGITVGAYGALDFDDPNGTSGIFTGGTGGNGVLHNKGEMSKINGSLTAYQACDLNVSNEGGTISISAGTKLQLNGVLTDAEGDTYVIKQSSGTLTIGNGAHLDLAESSPGTVYFDMTGGPLTTPAAAAAGGLTTAYLDGSLKMEGGSIDFSTGGTSGTFYYTVFAIGGYFKCWSGSVHIDVSKTATTVTNDQIVCNKAFINDAAPKNASISFTTYGSFASGDTAAGVITTSAGLVKDPQRSTYFDVPTGWTEVVNGNNL